MKKYFYYLLCITFLLVLSSCSKREASSQISGVDDNKKEISVTLAYSTPTDESLSVTQSTVPTLIPTLSTTVKPTSKPTKVPLPTVVSEVSSKEENSQYTIVIDAGHQKHQNSDPEPIGPGAKKTKAKVSSGTQGKFTDIPEYVVNLDVSLKLRDILKGLGYQVIMVRESNNVDISNAERAEIANDNKADVFVRIHCNGSEDTKVNGILTICPTKKNPYCSKIYKKSRSLSDILLKNLCDTTGAKNNGVTETDTMSGINWSKVPVTIIEMGYMTNKKEDYKLTSTKYQDRLAQGIADGIEEYLKQ